MKQIVIMPGGFHPFHAGHMALYNSAKKAFPDADVYVAATDSREERPFPFQVKEKLAKVAGVTPGRFIQVKSPFMPREITQNYNPEQDVLIFVRSEKDRNESPKPGGTKKDGSPSYFQPWTGKNVKPFNKEAYMAYLPTVTFGPGIKSATEIRNAWPSLNERQKTAMVMSLYPAAQKNKKLAANVVAMLDQVMGGEVNEASSPAQQAAIAINMKKHHKKPKVQEFAINHGDDGEEPDENEILRRLASQWWNGTVQEMIKAEKTLAIMGWEIGEDEGYDQGGVFVVRSGDEHGKSYISWPHEDLTESLSEDKGNEIADIVVDFYKPIIKDIEKDKLPDYVDQAREILKQTDDPTVREKLLDIFKKGKENPYLQGGIITTVGALLAGGVLNSAQTMGLSPQQTNLALQAILNTVIPTLVSRINGKNWKDTIKYTLASAGVGTSIAALTEKVTESQDYLEEK